MMAGLAQALALVLLLTAQAAVQPQEPLFHLSMHITSEVRGALELVSSSGNPGQCDQSPCECLGGAARRKTFLDTEAVALDTGSYFSGSGRVYPVFKGNASADIFAQAGYAAHGLTYRDFTAGGVRLLASYLERVRALDPSLPAAVVTNLDPAGGGPLGAEHIAPYALLDLADGRRMAVLSLTDPTHLRPIEPSYAARLLPYRQAVLVALAEMHRLPLGLPEVVVLMISGVPLDEADVKAAGGRTAAATAAVRQLVLEAVGVDIVVLADMDVTPSEPHLLKNWLDDDVLVVPMRAAELGTAVDTVNAAFTMEGRLAGNRSSANTSGLTCGISAHAATQTLVDSYSAVAVAKLGATLGSTYRHLNSAPRSLERLEIERSPGFGQFGSCARLRGSNYYCGCRVSECAQGALGADALAHVTSAHVALLNGGAIRDTHSSTALSRLDLLRIYPYTDEVVKLAVNGSVLRAALTNGISRLRADDAWSTPDGRFLQVSSSLKVEWFFDARTPTLGHVHVNTGGNRWGPLDDTAVYTIATTRFVASGGDGFSMLVGLRQQRLAMTLADAVARYVGESSSTVSVPTGRISPQPDLITIELGLLCKTMPVEAGKPQPLALSREECDHAHFTIGLMNDKTDGFFDELLPNAAIRTSEAHIGCVNNGYASAMSELRGQMPNLLAVLGSICSNDVQDLSSRYRRESGWDGVVISASSTAPSIADEARYRNVARLATDDRFLSTGNALLADYFGWKRVAVLHDNSTWATEAVKSFIEACDGCKILNKDDDLTRGFDVDSYGEGRADPVQLLRRLHEMDTRIVYLCVQPRIMRRIFAAVYTSKLLYGEGFGWISGWISEDALRFSDGSVDPDAVRGGEGVLGVQETSGDGTSLYDQYRQKWVERSSAEGCRDPNSTDYCDGDADPEAPLPGYSSRVVDSVVLFAAAVDRLLQDPERRDNPDVVYSTIGGLDVFDGVSGEVVLNAAADRKGDFKVMNLQVTTSRRLAETAAEISADADASHRQLYVPLSASTAEFEVVGQWHYGPAGNGIDGSYISIEAGQVIFPGGTNEPPSDRPSESANLALIIPVATAGALLLVCGLFCWQRRRAQKKITSLKRELQDFKDSIVGVRAVTDDYDPRQTGPVLSPVREAGARWYWQEDEARIGMHNADYVQQPGNYVAYAYSVCPELDRLYDSYRKGGGGDVATIDLTGRVGSTGTEFKAAAVDSGAVFRIDFGTMEQVNVKTNFRRKLLRAPLERSSTNQSGEAEAEEALGSMGGAPSGTGGWRTVSTAVRTTRTSAARTSVASAAERAAEGGLPAELRGEAILILHKGQLLQTSKQRPDGLAWGAVVFDVLPDRPPTGIDGLSTQAGWFPLSATGVPSSEQLEQLQKVMGGGAGASDALQPPKNWTPMKDALTPELVLCNNPERQAAINAFMQTMPNLAKVTESYAVKRQTILMRDGNSTGDAARRFERVWLFHGTDEETVPKIAQQGFNRSFCGKNATVHGKGVYFARDARYSSATRYSKPNNNGVQYIFLCRVTVGEYCVGKCNALTPDVRQGHQLYDSTVDNRQDPAIFVTYHDAQAYPEYLIKFTQ